MYFDKAGLEEVHGGKSYKVHIEPEGSYELYDKAGAVAETLKGEELLGYYDRKDKEIPGNSRARTASGVQSGKSYSEQGVREKEAKKDAPSDGKSGSMKTADREEKPAPAKAPPEPAREKSYEDAVHEGSNNAGVPDTKNRFNRFSQRTYDFDAMEKELISNNKEPEPAKRGAEPVQEDEAEAPEMMVKTNMGDMPVSDYREIVAGQYGFDSYDELYAAGLRIGCGYDKEPEALPGTKLPQPSPRPEAEFRPSVRGKLSGYKKEEEDAALKRQIEAAQAKRAAETRELEKTGGDVLPGQREKINAYKESRDAAMADFLSDAKLSERG